MRDRTKTIGRKIVHAHCEAGHVSVHEEENVNGDMYWYVYAKEEQSREWAWARERIERRKTPLSCSSPVDKNFL